MKVGDVVQYDHPAWGRSQGRVLRIGGEKGPGDVSTVLVQDLEPTGAREWWPVGDLVVEGGQRLVSGDPDSTPSEAVGGPSICSIMTGSPARPASC